jgi:hypothetical protein
MEIAGTTRSMLIDTLWGQRIRIAEPRHFCNVA